MLPQLSLRYKQRNIKCSVTHHILGHLLGMKHEEDLALFELCLLLFLIQDTVMQDTGVMAHQFRKCAALPEDLSSVDPRTHIR